ncbi:MAG: hypothetical protein ABFS21_03235 [Actinomycetota bacterium]
MEEAKLDPSSADSLVRIVTGHSVSSSSMVSRAYLTDSWRAVLVNTVDGGLWLAATLDALGPDTEQLLARGEANGGPPANHAAAALVKISVSWGDAAGRSVSGGEAHVANPKVVRHPGGAAIGVVSLAKARDLNQEILAGTGPMPITLEQASPCDDAEFDVVTLHPADDGRFWPVTRKARRASDPAVDFLDQPGAVALDLRLDAHDAGSPAFSGGGSSPVFRGLVRPVGESLAMLLPSRLIRETIASAGATSDNAV